MKKFVGAIVSVALVSLIIGVTNWPSWANALFIFVLIGFIIYIFFWSADNYS